MKKIIATTLLTTSLLSTSLFAGEDKFEYKLTGGAKGTLTLTGIGGAVSVAGLATNAVGGKYSGMYTMMIGANITILGVASFIGAAASSSGTKKLDKEGYAKEYKKFKALSKTIVASDLVVGSDAFMTVVEKFDCASCTTDKEKVVKYANIFLALDSMAKDIVYAEEFKLKNAEDVFADSKVSKKIDSLLGSDNNTRNKSFVEKSLALAIVNYAIEAGK